MTITVGSLCTGTGGLEMGLALAIGKPVRHAWHAEIEGIVKKGKRKGELSGPRAILAARYPGIPNYGDIKTLDYALMEPVDLLAAGYPCQPFSNAGLRLGEADERHLWPYVGATIGALRPRYVLLENVRGHVRNGLRTVIGDLAGLGYDARWGVVLASEAGAPHPRARVFILATDTRGERHGRWQDGRSLGDADRGLEGEAWQRQRARQQPGDRGAETTQDADSATGRERRLAAPGQAQGGRSWADACGRGGAPAPDTAGVGRGEGRAESARLIGGSHASERSPEAWGIYAPAIARWERVTGRPAPRATEPRGRDGAERLSPRFVEWMMGLPAGWVTDVPDLSVNEQLKALGNGVVPQQAALAIRTLANLSSMPSSNVVERNIA